MSQSPVINTLPLPTRSKLRSAQILTSLPQIVSELLQNALDAGATHVNIGVDCEAWSCWVRDDGSGISKEGLEILGQGGRYNTSKTYTTNAVNEISTFGFRGEALSSAAEFSCLEICSRTTTSRETWSVILKGGKSLYAGPAVRWRRESAGTAVCIRDAFYNLPVRRSTHPNPLRTMEIIRRELEAYCLVFPEVAFTLEDTRRAGDSSSSKDKTIRMPKTPSILASFRNIYGRALAELVEEIDLSSGRMRVYGFISLTGAHTKTYQFLYINRHPIAYCDIHLLIDSKFSASSFAKDALEEDGETTLQRTMTRRSPRKAEKRPIYVLNLTISQNELDNCLEPSKNTLHLKHKSSVYSFLSSTIDSFLEKHNFISKAQQDTSNRTLSPSPRKRRRTNVESNIDVDSFSDLSALSLQEPVCSKDILVSMDNDGQEVVWVDSHTKERFAIDSRTGHSYCLIGADTNCQEPHDQTSNMTRTLSRHAESGKGNKDAVPEWLQRALLSNSTYGISEHAIPELSASSKPETVVQTTDFPKYHDSFPTGQKNQQIFRDQANSISYKKNFNKEDLRYARTINQVDKKFIVCLIARNGECEDALDSGSDISRTIILIDQHAADERIRVERFLKEICSGFLGNCGYAGSGVKIRELEPPRLVLLTRYEAMSLKNSKAIQKTFQCWGFMFPDLLSIGEARADNGLECDPHDLGEYIQIPIKSIPEILSDKLLQGDELRDLIKGFLSQLNADELSPPQPPGSNANEDEEEHNWLKALRFCPQGVVELINSKACRGAIMFNDSLSISQCRRLIRQLSETAFPFQCAHGRPSLVPLAEIGMVGGRRSRTPIHWNRLEEDYDC